MADLEPVALMTGLVSRQAGQFMELKHIFRKMTAVTIAMLIITVLSTMLRIFVRVKMLGQYGKEDWSILAAMAFFGAFASCTFVESAQGIALVDGGSFDKTLWKREYKAGYAMWACCLVATKFSLGFFFLRILGHRKNQRYIIHAIMALTTLVGAAYFCLIAFTCADITEGNPLQKKCADPVQNAATGVLATFSSLNIAGDFLLTALGLIALWKAKLGTHTKVIAGFLLILGSVGGVASIIRLTIVLKTPTLAGYLNQLYLSALWAEIEISTAIIAANLAMVRPLLQFFLQKMGLVSTIHTSTRQPTAASTPLSRLRSSRRDTRDHGNDLLLDEIRKETTVTVDEEKGVPTDISAAYLYRAGVQQNGL